MLIRSHNNELLEYPDDLVAMMLASPFHGDLDDESDWSMQEINCLIHAMLGAAFDETLTLEQNIEKIRNLYAPFGEPTAANLKRAQALVRFYNENLTVDEIGYSDKETIRAVFPFQNTAHIVDAENVLEQALKPVDTAAVPVKNNDLITRKLKH